MRVLLSTAPSDVPEQTIPDLGLGYLATALRRSCQEARIVQPEREGGGFEPVARMVREFDFIDDNFVTRRQYVQELCERILEAGLDIEWSCAGVHLKGLTPDLIRLMERSGCRSLVVGVESGNDEILRHMRKGIRTQEVRERLEIIKDVSKMMVMGQFILGYPLDTPRTIRQTIGFACRLPLDLATFYSFIPLPGSEAYDYLLERGEIQAPDWKAVRIAGTCYAPPGMTLRQLTHLRRVAYLRFYLRPRILGRMAREIATPRQIGAYLSRIKGRLLQA